VIISRTAVVVDGDTIELHVGDKVILVRLWGIDSPEASHAGGPEASTKIAELIAGKDVQCVQVGGGTPCDGRSKPTSRKRIVAQCFVGGVGSSKEMVYTTPWIGQNSRPDIFAVKDEAGRPTPICHPGTHWLKLELELEPSRHPCSNPPAIWRWRRN